MKVKVTLTKNHTHAGRPYKAGAQIEVGQHDIEWLVDKKVIEPLPNGGKGGKPAEENAK